MSEYNKVDLLAEVLGVFFLTSLLIQDALRSSFEASLVPAFEKSCKVMFDQVDATFQKGMIEHTAATPQHIESIHSQLALALRVRMV